MAGYSLTLALASMAFFTLAPAARAWKQPLLPWLKAGEQGVARGRSPLSSSLVVLQLALAVLFITPTDPLTYGTVLLLLSLVSLTACSLPAVRASRVNPISTLRQE